MYVPTLQFQIIVPPRLLIFGFFVGPPRLLIFRLSVGPPPPFYYDPPPPLPHPLFGTEE